MREAPLPTSGEIIGFLARTLEWSFEPVKERTWRNFAAGKRVSPETRRAVFRELAGMFVPEDFGEGQEQREEHLEALTHLFSENADWWDSLVGAVAILPSQSRQQLTAEVALRLATSELAQRFAAFLALGRLACPSEELPDWFQENAVRDRLRALLKQAKVTREALATACRVEKQAVDKWLDAPLPPDRRIKSIVNVALKQLPPEQRREVSEDLLRLRLKAKLAQQLAARIGWVEVQELGRAFFRLTKAALVALEAVSFASEEERLHQLGEWLSMGSDAPLAQQLQPRIAAAEPNRRWSYVAQLSSDDWFKRLTLAQLVPEGISWFRETVTSKKVRHYSSDLQRLMEHLLRRVPLAPQAVIDLVMGHIKGVMRAAASDPEAGMKAAHAFYVERLEDIEQEQDRVVALRRLERIIDLLAVCLDFKPDTRMRADFERLTCRYHFLRILRLLQDVQATRGTEGHAPWEERRLVIEQALEELRLCLSRLEAASESQGPHAGVQRIRDTVWTLQQALERGDVPGAVSLASGLALDDEAPLSHLV